LGGRPTLSEMRSVDEITEALSTRTERGSETPQERREGFLHGIKAILQNDRICMLVMRAEALVCLRGAKRQKFT